MKEFGYGFNHNFTLLIDKCFKLTSNLPITQDHMIHNYTTSHDPLIKYII